MIPHVTKSAWYTGDSYIYLSIHLPVDIQKYYSSLHEYQLQSLKFSTFPFLRSLIDRSSCVHCLFTIHSPFTILRSPFSVRWRSLFTKRSSFAHRAFSYRSQTFIVRSSFLKRSAIFIRNSNVKGSFLNQWQNKDGTCAEWWVKTFSLYQKFHC